jgi:nitrile hydratase accessory protein
VFAEPWQAEAFALVTHLHALGAFTWPEWAAALAAEIAAGPRGTGTDVADAYHAAWLAALERLVVARGLASPRDLAERKAAWAEAYRHTPHGQPVALPT